MSVQPQTLVQDVRLYIFNQAAETTRVPQAMQIAAAFDRPVDEIRRALIQLAEARVIVLKPHTTEIWAAAPFAAERTDFRVDAIDKSYGAVCIWDALGVAAALGTGDAVVHTTCGDCGAAIHLELRDGTLVYGAGVVHFGVPARHFWDNIAFT